MTRRRSIRRRGGGLSRVSSAPPRSRRKSKSKGSPSRPGAIEVSKVELKRAGRESGNVGKTYSYRGTRLKLKAADKFVHEQGGRTRISEPIWIIAGDLEIQIL